MSQQINLFNPIFLKQKKYFSLATIAQGIALIVFGALLFYAYAAYQVANMERQASEAAKRLAVEQERLSRVAAEFAPGKKSRLLEEELARLEGQLSARQKVLQYLQGGGLGDTAGFSEYLRAFSRQAIDGLWLTGFSIREAGAQMSLDGRALKPELVPAYIQRLDNEKVMQGKGFAGMEIGLPAARPDKEGGKGVMLQPRFVEFRLMSAGQEAGK